MDPSSALRMLFLFSGILLANCSLSVVPQVSEDMEIPQGGSFNFTCEFVLFNWGQEEGNYVQVYKKAIEFHRLSGINRELQPEGSDMLKWVITTDTQLSPDVDSTRYEVSFDTTSSLRVSVSDAQPEDRGLWTCRLILEDSASTTIDERVSETEANITIISPILNMVLLTSDDTQTSEDWMDDFTEVTDEVTLNYTDPMRFGCKVEYNSVLPTLSAYFELSDDTQYDVTDLDGDWKVSQPTAFVNDNQGEFTYVHVDSLFLTGTTNMMLNLGYLDGTRFVCKASLPQQDDMELDIHVTAQGGTEDRPLPSSSSSSSRTFIRPGLLIIVVALVGFLYIWQGV